MKSTQNHWYQLKLMRSTQNYWYQLKLMKSTQNQWYQLTLPVFSLTYDCIRGGCFLMKLIATLLFLYGKKNDIFIFLKRIFFFFNLPNFQPKFFFRHFGDLPHFSGITPQERQQVVVNNTKPQAGAAVSQKGCQEQTHEARSWPEWKSARPHSQTSNGFVLHKLLCQILSVKIVSNSTYIAKLSTHYIVVH